MENNELQHWGIKGMKWGVRRYQNSDGTLTAAGKKRYNKELAKLREEKKVLENKRKTQAKLDKLDTLEKEVKEMKSGKKPEPKETVEQKKERILNSRSPAALYKNAHLFSDDELTKAYNRLTTEKNIRELTPKEIDKGKEFLDEWSGKTKSIKELSSNTIDMYNNVAKVFNSVPSLNQGKQWPIVKG